ncbi:MAG: hypothetical protein LBT16_08255 [Treponema sp.]|nr:hypothetical protein [Treponema sp.]
MASEAVTQEEKERAWRISAEKYELDLRSHVVHTIRQIEAAGDTVSEAWKITMAIRFLRGCAYTVEQAASITCLPIETVSDINDNLLYQIDRAERRKARQIAYKLKSMSIPIEQIALGTGLNEEQVKELWAYSDQ